MFENRNVIGGDTETVKGTPYTVQLWSKDGGKIVFVNERNVLETFVNCLLQYPSNSVLFFHNLDFDLPILFFPFLEQFQTQTYFELSGGGFKANILYGKVCHVDIWLGKDYYEIVDSFAFFKTSLENLSRTFNFPGKMRKPRKLGEIRYHGLELDYFRNYALRDAEITYLLGEKILDFHRKYNVKLAMSAPQLSGRIFRKDYIPKDSLITACPPDCDEAAVLSYHGGKNGMYCEPGIYDGVKLYDINSAYPFAFTKLPNFLNCEYDWVKGKTIKERHGIYKISGFSKTLPYNPLRDAGFQPIYGNFENIWVTSFELFNMLKYGFIESVTILEGYLVRENHRVKVNPLAKFACDFYRLKTQEKGNLREFYKIILNSLYGKFIQNVQNSDLERLKIESGKVVSDTNTFIAGGLWNPLLASLITGFVRAYLTEFELSYDALHSSTDSIITKSKIPTGEELGQWNLKDEGSVVLIRPKLYVMWNRNREVTSFALHGFHGTLQSFIQLLRSGKRKYFHRRMIRLRESRIQRKTPLIVEGMFKNVNLPFEGELLIPPLKFQGKWI